MVSHLSGHGGAGIDVFLRLGNAACNLGFHGIKPFHGVLAGGVNGPLHQLLQLLQPLLDVALDAFLILGGQGGEGIQGGTFFLRNFRHGPVVGMAVFVLQFQGTAGDGLLDGGQGLAVAGIFLRQLAGKLLHSGGPVIQLSMETSNLVYEIVLQIVHPNIGVLLQLVQRIVKGPLQLGDVFLGPVLQLDEGLVLQVLGLLGGIGINVRHAAGDALENLLVLCHGGFRGGLQLLHLVVEPIQQLGAHLLQLLAVFLRKIGDELGDTAFHRGHILLVLMHLLFKLVHNGRLGAHTTHILFQIGGHLHQLLDGGGVGGNIVVDVVHCLNPGIHILRQLVKLPDFFLQVPHRGNGLGLLHVNLVVLVLEASHLVVKFCVKVILLYADIFSDLVQGTIVPVDIPQRQRKDRRNTNSYEYSKDRHILFPTQKIPVSLAHFFPIGDSL